MTDERPAAELLSRRSLSRLLARPESEIRAWAAAGCPAVTTARGWVRFDLAAVLGWRLSGVGGDDVSSR